MTLRIWIIAVVSLVLGLAIGWGWTVAQLGFSPQGSDRVARGNLPQTKNSLPPPAKGPAGAATVEETEYDFGKMETGGSGRHEFVIHNTGKGILALEKGPTTCSCTVSEIDRTQLAPGEVAKVTVQWHPKGHGTFRQSASIRTNDPDKPTLDLTVSGGARLVVFGRTLAAGIYRNHLRR